MHIRIYTSNYDVILYQNNAFTYKHILIIYASNVLYDDYTILYAGDR